MESFRKLQASSQLSVKSFIQNELKTAINAYLEIMGLIFLCDVNQMH